MNRLLLLTCMLLCVAGSFAQRNTDGILRGKVMDTTGHQPLADATISIMLLKDSSSVAFTTANAKGGFEVKGLDPGHYRLLVTFEGYQYISRPFSISPEKPIMDFGVLAMEKKSTLLQEVIVERPPITVKKDTVEYNASSFKTKPNEDVEGLLKKLPGVQVERDGTVKSQGEEIKKVYVDGKEFFGTDPKLATKNLTADMVETVQVFDDMSEQAKFTKIDDGSRQKVMNLKLKKDKKNGYFGKVNAGAGTDSRYDNSLSFNRFKGNTQLSVIAAVNNTNKQGFSFSDIISTMGGFGNGGPGGGGGFGGGGGGGIGGMGQMVATRGGIAGLGFGGSSNGITTSMSTGLNYRDAWGPKIDVTGSYFLSHTKNDGVQDIYRQTLFPNDSNTYTTEHRISQNQNMNHRFNLRFEYRIDSLNSILYTPSFTIQHSEGFSDDSTQVRSVQGTADYLALKGQRHNDNDRDGINLGNNLLYRRRLGRPGRTFTLGWSNAWSHSNGDGNNISPQFLLKPNGDTLSTALSQNYHSNQITNSNNNVISTSYTEPVGRNKIIEVNYAYSNSQGSSDKKTNNYNSLNGKYDVPNPLQTNYFTNSAVYHRAGGNFRLQEKKYNYQLGGSVQFTTLESHLFTANGVKDSIAIQRNYINFTPTASFNYNPAMGTNLRFNYRGRNNQPSTSQLQDVQDVSNPQNIRTGNPDLKQEFAHSLNISYNTFKLINFQFMAVNFNVNLTQNKIVNSITKIGNAAQLTRPVNMNGAFNTMVFFTYGKTMRRLKGGNINANSLVTYNHDVSMLFGERNNADGWTLTQSLGLNYNHNQIDFGFNGSLTYSSTHYSQQPNLNTAYYTQVYSPEATYTFFKSLLLSTDLDYTVTSGLSNGYNQSVPYWNASLALQVFKKKDGEIKLGVYDILNQNKSFTRSTGDNYVQDMHSNVLQRYFMISFTYNLRKGSQQNNNPMQMMPKMFQKGMNNMRIMN